jgi:hypothetical protein
LCVHDYTHALLLCPPLTVGSIVDLTLLAPKVPNFCHFFSCFSIIRVLNFCLVVEIIAALGMEALFGSNNHGGHKAADLASLIIAQVALEVPRLLGLLAMVKVSLFSRLTRNIAKPLQQISVQ